MLGGYMHANQMQSDYFKGRGAQLNIHNPFLSHAYVQEHVEAQDEPYLTHIPTEFLQEYPRKIVNKVSSPDIPMDWSLNPYQGCEHGCIYCYARPTHQYWGYSAGLDFERKIIIKENAADLLKEKFASPHWEPAPIMLSGNTDCYQPIERKKELTRKILAVCAEFRHPISIITKNSLILRDLDILSELNSRDLVHIAISITTLDEDLRQKMEPRTASVANRLETIRQLSQAGIPVSVMVAPIIPGLNNHEVADIIKEAADRGARSAGYTMVRLNGPVGELFEDWVRKSFPDRAEKVLNQVSGAHGGKLGDSRFGTRMRGEGKMAETVRDLFQIAKKRYMAGRIIPPYNLQAFRRPHPQGQLSLFD